MSNAAVRFAARYGETLDEPEIPATEAETDDIPLLPEPGTPERAKFDAAQATMIAGLLRVAHMRPVGWADPSAIPGPGCFCARCQGQRWWGDAAGWRCAACRPPDGPGSDHSRQINTAPVIGVRHVPTER